MGLGRASSDHDVKYLYYKECKKDTAQISQKLALWLAEECVSLNDIELFNFIASKYPLQITSMFAASSLMQSIAFHKNKKFAQRMIDILSYQPDGKERIKELVKKLNTTDPGRYNEQNAWLIEFFFDEGIISSDGTKKYPFDIAFYAMPTEIIEKAGRNAKIDEFTVSGICRQNVLKSIKKRMELYLKSPTFWEYLKKHPDEVDTEMGFGTFQDYMPEDKAAEIDNIRRGRLSGRKFGF